MGGGVAVARVPVQALFSQSKPVVCAISASLGKPTFPCSREAGPAESLSCAFDRAAPVSNVDRRPEDGFRALLFPPKTYRTCSRRYLPNNPISTPTQEMEQSWTVATKYSTAGYSRLVGLHHSVCKEEEELVHI